MAIHGENWIEWELDPSTRSSVHLWTKYVPISAAVGTSAADLFTLNRGAPAVNHIKNPSFEHATLTEFTKIGDGVAPPDAAARITYASDGQVADDLPSPIDGRTYVAEVSRASGNSTLNSDGFYWKDTFAGLGQYGSVVAFSLYVRGTESGPAGTVKLQIIDDDDAAVLVDGTAHTLTNDFARLSLEHKIEKGAPKTLRFAIVAASVFALNSKFYYVDAFANKIVDKVGAGDTMLSVISPCIKSNFDSDISLLVSSLAASQSVESIGNKFSINKTTLLRTLENVLK